MSVSPYVQTIKQLNQRVPIELYRDMENKGSLFSKDRVALFHWICLSRSEMATNQRCFNLDSCMNQGLNGPFQLHITKLKKGIFLKKGRVKENMWQ